MLNTDERQILALKARADFDIIRALVLPAIPSILAPCAIVWVGWGQPDLLKTVLIVGSLIIGFSAVVGFPIGLAMTYFSTYEVGISTTQTVIFRNENVTTGLSVPVTDVKWKIDERERIVFYPYSYLRFVRSLGLQPSCLRLSLSEETRLRWIALLQSGSEGKLD